MTDDPPVRAYLQAVASEFALLGSTTSPTELSARRIPLPDGRGFLVPLCALHLEDDRIVELLARWREANEAAYATQFHVTIEGTRRWLRDAVLGSPDRILFLVVDSSGREIGHLGFTHCLNDRRRMELDNVGRGEQAAPGLMGSALDTLCAWATRAFEPAEIYLRVLEDNDRARRFYRRHGWREVGTEAIDGERTYVVMSLRGNADATSGG